MTRDAHAPTRRALSALTSAFALALAGSACMRDAQPGDRSLRTERDEFGVITCSGKTTGRDCYTHRALLGVSMGAGGAGQLGFARPELFDTIGMLGIPIVDWVFMLRYMQRAYLGGFCDRDTILAHLDEVADPTGRASCAPLPAIEKLEPSGRVLEPEQTFNRMFIGAPGGRGGPFGRNTLRESLSDLSFAFGNPLLYNPDSPSLPPGVTREFLEKSDEERCANPVIIRNFVDREYNPDGSAPVITFCDTRTDGGDFDPARGNEAPHGALLAVDYNANGIRDFAEPVVSTISEPYEDSGSGDAYDWNTNPGGRAGNWLHDEGEPFEDLGLDGVPGTGDYGEGNGRFDYNPNVLNYLAQNPRTLIETMPEEQLQRISIWADAGLRDFLASAAGTNWLWGALRLRAGARAKDYTEFKSLLPGESEFDFLAVDYSPDAIGQYAYLRYGDPAASELDVEGGDGNHVGTPDQILNRLLTAMSFAESRFLDRNRRAIDSEQPITELIQTKSYYSPALGEERSYGIMFPPGYEDPRNAAERYPVIYFLHGQGMGFNQLLASALLYFGYMSGSTRSEVMRRRESDWAKMLLVFPDSLCHHGECEQGNFNANFVGFDGDGPRYQDALFELIAHVDETYRVAKPVEIAR